MISQLSASFSVALCIQPTKAAAQFCLVCHVDLSRCSHTNFAQVYWVAPESLICWFSDERLCISLPSITASLSNAAVFNSKYNEEICTGLCLPRTSVQCSLGTWNSSGTRSVESDLGSAELCVTYLTEKHCKSVPDYSDLIEGGCYVIEAFFK